MAYTRSVMAIIEKTEVNPYYDMRFADIIELFKNSKGDYYIMSNAFVFVYAQGVKAERAAQRKAAGI